jgi:hypothetical protein
MIYELESKEMTAIYLHSSCSSFKKKYGQTKLFLFLVFIIYLIDLQSQLKFFESLHLIKTKSFYFFMYFILGFNYSQYYSVVSAPPNMAIILSIPS